ncbi:MAG: hypothetical protein PHF84_05485 [bacterium]|nr:hypothetical protein [bacterium]
MKIEIKSREPDEFTEDMTVDEKQLFAFKWNSITPANYSIISEKIFFHFDLDIRYNKETDKNKLVLIGEYNDKFWFFKIIRKKPSDPLAFNIKKPALEKIHEIKISIVDWYNVITKFNPVNIGIEYAVSRDE